MFVSTLLIVIGFGLLFFGRKLFWLSVAAFGFVLGMSLTEQLFPSQSDTTVLLAGLALGLVGAVIAIFLQKIAVGVAGFFAGGFLLSNLAGRFDLQIPGQAEYWVPFVIGGILGAILLINLFELALIAISALVGSYLIVHHLGLNPGLSLPIFIVLAIGGMVVQYRMNRKKGRSNHKE